MEAAQPKIAFGQPAVAKRYGDVHPRTVKRRYERGEIPPPDFYQGRLPYWWQSTLDTHDEAAAREEREHREAAAREERARREAEKKAAASRKNSLTA